MAEQETARAIHLLAELEGGALHQVFLSNDQRDMLGAFVLASLGTLRIGPVMQSIYVDQQKGGSDGDE